MSVVHLIVQFNILINRNSTVSGLCLQLIISCRQSPACCLQYFILFFCLRGHTFAQSINLKYVYNHRYCISEFETYILCVHQVEHNYNSVDCIDFELKFIVSLTERLSKLLVGAVTNCARFVFKTII